jgi:hypothetical protein
MVKTNYVLTYELNKSIYLFSSKQCKSFISLYKISHEPWNKMSSSNRILFLVHWSFIVIILLHKLFCVSNSKYTYTYIYIYIPTYTCMYVCVSVLEYIFNHYVWCEIQDKNECTSTEDIMDSEGKLLIFVFRESTNQILYCEMIRKETSTPSRLKRS